MPNKQTSSTLLLIITIALSMGTFIQILDTSIANVSIPFISGDLGASSEEGTWVITSFAVSNAIVLPLTGLLSRRFSEVRLFVASTTLFSLTSWLCGLAWNLPVLIFFRVLQGAAGGALIPLSQSLLLQLYPKEKKGIALGIWSMVVVVAPIVGPILGGWITDNYGWRWIFYINIPLGFASAVLTWMTIWEKQSKTSKEPIDYMGFVLLCIAVGALQIFLDKGNQEDWFKSNSIVILFLISFIGFLFFIPWNLYSPYPVVNFSFFKDKNFLIGTIITALGFFVFFGSVVLLPLWLQTQNGYTATWAGLAVAPIGIFPLLLSLVVGHYVNILDQRLVLTWGYLVFAFTFFWLGDFNTQVSFFHIALPRFIQGIGLACFFIPLVTLSLSQVPNEQLASASGLFNFIRLLAGGGFGTSLFVTLWSRREDYHHSYLIESISPYSPLSRQLFSQITDNLHLETQNAKQLVDNTVSSQSYMLATNDVFWLSGWIFLVMIPFIWLCDSHLKAGGQAHHHVVGE
ncbi:Multidrug export protein EmrB [Chlamydiales bacterium STE3]|nr:Multidrug export protein EmrB [Chlamydiales bacterium STE3]